MIVHRPIPDGMTIKTATITQKEVGIILSACGGLDIDRPVKQENSEAWIQLSLFVSFPL
ncbi:MAG: hypothetical protein QNJ74_13505 [Trichodesmium sp. MO_231.B1]|nr:hypothetical protein [Trichodesmium sp. MO_231.B1]